MNRFQAIALLDEYAFNPMTGSLIECRVRALTQSGIDAERAEIRFNNDYHTPPGPQDYSKSVRIGCTTKRIIWAVELIANQS